MKTLIRVLVVILLVLVLAIAGILGFMWYRNNHIFVEDAVYPIDSQYLDLREEDISFEHYESLRAQLPDCEILWMVPFHGGKYASNTQSLQVSSLSTEDVAQIAKYFPDLKTLDATECDQYDVLAAAEEALPACEVRYDVYLGGPVIDHNAATLITGFSEADDFETLKTNLAYLPNLQTLKLTDPALSLEQMEELCAAYPQIAISRTVGILGLEYETDTTELDLSAVSPENLAEVVKKLPLLPNLSYLELMAQDGTSPMTKTDVKMLMEAAPNAVIHYSFDFHGYTISTADEEVHIVNKKIGEEGLPEVREILDIMTNCKRFVLENCQIPNETMAQLREDYRDKTKIVWRVSYGKGSTMTDAEIIRAVYDLVDDNCHNLIYCEDARFMDIGHNEWLDGCDFVAGMKSLEYVIVSGAPIKSLEPFRNCKNLRVLEIAFCEYIEDLSPLADCENLQMLNISNTHAYDLSPLDDLPLTHLCVRNNPSGRCRLSQEEQDRVIAQHPDCWISFSGAQPYGVGWRYDEDEHTHLDHYEVIRVVFRLDLDPNIPNHVGWYLKDEERAEIEKLEASMDAALAERSAKDVPVEEAAETEETIVEETTETIPTE